MTEVDEQLGQTAETVRSIILPLSGDALLLPGAMLAEVLSCGDLKPIDDAPQWLVGSISWRERELPVIDLSGQRDGPSSEGEQHKLAVVYALHASAQLRCYGLLCNAVPRPVQASPLSVKASAGSESVERKFEAQAVRVDGERAYIPDIDALESAMLEGAGSWLQFAADGAGVSLQ